jgi:type II secretory pathway pseudopilin PulG
MRADLYGKKIKLLTRFWRPEPGVGLAETLIAVAILSLTAVALLSAFSTGTMALNKGQTKTAAENLARNQLEFTKSQPYLSAPASYPVMTPVPAEYSISTRAEPVDGRDEKIQKVTVEVQRNGSVVFTLEGLKLDQ